MSKRRIQEPISQKEKTSSRNILFYQFSKTPFMNSKTEDKSVYQIVDSLRHHNVNEPVLSGKQLRYPVAEDISAECGFLNSFRVNINKLVFNFYIVNENEIFATFGKKDSPVNAKVKARNVYIDEFTIEYFSFLYFSVRDNVMAAMQGSRVPNISESFVELCTHSNANFEYSLKCVLDKHIYERFEKAQSVKEVAIKLAAPNISILKKQALSEEQLAVITSNKFILTEARLVFTPNIITKKSLKEALTKLVPALKKKQPSISDVSVKFVDDSLNDEIIRASENFVGKSVIIPVNQRVNPQIVYKAMQEAYNENRTSVLDNIFDSEVVI